MKLRFGIDAAAHARIHGTLDGLCEEPPIGRRLSHVYLDTPDGDLAAHGFALRFRRSTALGVSSPRRPWRRQTLRPKDADAAKSIKKLGVKRLRQRLDATFDVRIERWTWRVEDGWAHVSLDRSEISTGTAHESFAELRVVCARKNHEAAMAFAVGLGAMHLSSMKVRERGEALFARTRERSPS